MKKEEKEKKEQGKGKQKKERKKRKEKEQNREEENKILDATVYYFQKSHYYSISCLEYRTHIDHVTKRKIVVSIY